MGHTSWDTNQLKLQKLDQNASWDGSQLFLGVHRCLIWRGKPCISSKFENKNSHPTEKTVYTVYSVRWDTSEPQKQLTAVSARVLVQLLQFLLTGVSAWTSHLRLKNWKFWGWKKCLSEEKFSNYFRAIEKQKAR